MKVSNITEKFMSFDTDTTTNRNTTTNKLGTFTTGSTTDNKTNKTVQHEPTAMLKAGPPYPKEDVPKVKQIQSVIQDLGYDLGSTGVDGKYGPRTARAVRAFKSDYNVPGNGLEFGNTATAKLADVAKGTIPKVAPEKQTKIDTSYAGGGEVGPMQSYAGPPGETSGKIGKLLDMISKPESGGRYDMVYPGRRRPKIVDMTIADLIQDMKRRGRDSGSSASGRYQYIRKTLHVQKYPPKMVETYFTLGINHPQRPSCINGGIITVICGCHLELFVSLLRPIEIPFLQYK